MLTDKQYEAINLLVTTSQTKAEIAKKIGISERGLYKWLNKEEFKVELQKRADDFQANITTESKKKMTGYLNMAIDNIVTLANDSESDKIKLDANVFIYESLLGKATTKVADVTKEENKEKEVNIEDILNELDNDNNVINLEERIK